MTKKPRERSPGTACNVISRQSARMATNAWRHEVVEEASNKGETDYRFVK